MNPLLPATNASVREGDAANINSQTNVNNSDENQSPSAFKTTFDKQTQKGDLNTQTSEPSESAETAISSGSLENNSGTPLPISGELPDEGISELESSLLSSLDTEYVAQSSSATTSLVPEDAVVIATETTSSSEIGASGLLTSSSEAIAVLAVPNGAAQAQSVSPLNSQNNLGYQGLAGGLRSNSLNNAPHQLSGLTPLSDSQTSESLRLSVPTKPLESNIFRFSDTEKMVDKTTDKPLLSTGVSTQEKQLLVKSDRPFSMRSETLVLADKMNLVTTSPTLVSESASQPLTQNVLSQASVSQFSPSLTTDAARMQLPVNITFGQQGWGNMVAERSAMMASQSIRFAELQLDPPELGPLQVKVSVNQEQGQASVSFVATNANVKDALDQTLPRLKELLEEQGLDLVDVDVSDQSQESESDPEAEDSQLSDGEDVDNPSENDPEQTVQIVSTYGVDQYA